ncbi:MAG: hypothetical protein AAGD25_16045 [Cyanobacteria bacterium P01_F01_bin.150]
MFLLKNILKNTAATKIIVTGRGHIALQNQLNLSPLSDKEASELIKKQADEKNIEISAADCFSLAQQSCNIPSVILYAVGQIAAGAIVSYVLHLGTAEGELATHLFEEAIAPLSDRPSYHILMALALFPKPPLPDALAAVAFSQPNPITTEKGLTTLLQLSLIECWENTPTRNSRNPKKSATPCCP